VTYKNFLSSFLFRDTMNHEQAVSIVTVYVIVLLKEITRKKEQRQVREGEWGFYIFSGSMNKKKEKIT
jgi:hypothetical protein